MPTKKSTSTEKTKCPKCESEIKKGWKFCNDCGRTLVCKCGEDLSELKGDYCPICGENIQKPKTETVTKAWTPDAFIPRFEPKPWTPDPYPTYPKPRKPLFDPYHFRPGEPKPYVPSPFGRYIFIDSKQSFNNVRT